MMVARRSGAVAALCILAACVAVATVTSDSSEDVEYDEGDYEDYEDYNDFNATTNGTIQFVRELKNVTRSGGQIVRFMCEVKNLEANSTGRVKLKWKKNYLDMLDDERYKVKTIVKKDEQLYKTWLKVRNLEVLDRGNYSCIATKGNEKIISTAFLEVNAKWGNAGTGDLPTYKPAFGNRYGYKKSLDFSSKHKISSPSGEDITTFLPNTDNTKDRDFLSTISNPVLPSLSEQTIHNPSLFDKSQRPQPTAAYNSSQPFCQPYEGTACRQFLDTRFVFIQPPFTQKKIEENLENAFLVISQSNDISSSCSKFALPSLCYSAFPICVEPEQTNGYQKIYISNLAKNKTYKYLRNMLSMKLQRVCKQDCILLETELCSREYSIAKRHPVIGQTLDLEECEYLPEEDEKNSLFCLKLGVDRTQEVDKDDTCFWDSGEHYRGILDVTVTNTKCIRWAHQQHVPLSDHPELIGHNYCRNPGGMQSEPYCYVEHSKREFCGLPKCANILWTYIVGTAVILIVLITFALSFYCCKRNNKHPRSLRNMSIPTADKNIYGNGGPSSPMELNNLLPANIPPARGHHTKNGFQNVPQYTYKEVAFIEELGEGAFGKVYKGELRAKTGKVFVAVKSLKENASAKTQADFQREIELISELKHPNIICLLGVVMKQEPMCMLFEYMSEGDLHEFLIGNSPGEGKSLTQLQFLHISIQIAQGMEYLSENHYVHRDLAARNCLVSRDLIVKISDFGLSRDMYSCDYYRVQSKSLLPVRWMPPESILYGKFTTESDVWSYGVVLWEIYSYGLQPYYGYNNQEVINMIRSRKLLPCPDACPSYCYALMVECWAELAIRRPSFGEISHRLRVWKQNGNSAGAYFKTPENSAQKYGHSSKSSHSTSDSQTVINPQESQTWERSNPKKVSAGKLDGSQSSLTSRSSLGNKTQSTNLSDQNTRNSRKSIDRKSQRSLRNDNSLERLNPKRTVVSSNGDMTETKLSN